MFVDSAIFRDEIAGMQKIINIFRLINQKLNLKYSTTLMQK